MTKRTVEIYEGEVNVDPYGEWEDVDHGTYIGGDRMDNVISDLEGNKVRVTIEIFDY